MDVSIVTIVQNEQVQVYLDFICNYQPKCLVRLYIKEPGSGY